MDLPLSTRTGVSPTHTQPQGRQITARIVSFSVPASEATSRTACRCPQLRFALGRLNRSNAAIRMAAQADNFHPVPDALAVVAAIFLSLGSKTGTGRIRAFLGIRHIPP